MAETTKDLSGAEQFDAARIQANRGTSHPLHDPANPEGLMKAAVNAALVEEAGYMRVRYTGKESIIVQHNYWNPGEVRTIHPGDYKNLVEKYKADGDVTFVELDTPPLASAADERQRQAQAALGESHTGEKQMAALLDPSVKTVAQRAKEAKESADFTRKHDAAQTKQDAAKGEKTVVVTSAERERAENRAAAHTQTHHEPEPMVKVTKPEPTTKNA